MLTHSRLLELLHYDPKSGVFTWRIRTGSTVSGQIAGGINSDGYLQIKIDRVLHKAHRLAWFYIHGEMPSDLTDHRNRIRTDNRIRNIRCATSSQNACNRSLRSDNTSGVTGVNWNIEFGKWRVRVMCKGKRILVGDFYDFDEAVAARIAAAKRMHGKFAMEIAK